jgi:hypothetical protein
VAAVTSAGEAAVDTSAVEVGAAVTAVAADTADATNRRQEIHNAVQLDGISF